MFSADVFCAKRDFPPKNGPVPIQAVNAHTPNGQRETGIKSAPEADNIAGCCGGAELGLF